MWLRSSTYVLSAGPWRIPGRGRPRSSTARTQPLVALRSPSRISSRVSESSLCSQRRLQPSDPTSREVCLPFSAPTRSVDVWNGADGVAATGTSGPDAETRRFRSPDHSSPAYPSCPTFDESIAVSGVLVGGVARVKTRSDHHIGRSCRSPCHEFDSPSTRRDRANPVAGDYAPAVREARELCGRPASRCPSPPGGAEWGSGGVFSPGENPKVPAV